MSMLLQGFVVFLNAIFRKDKLSQVKEGVATLHFFFTVALSICSAVCYRGLSSKLAWEIWYISIACCDMLCWFVYETLCMTLTRHGGDFVQSWN